MSRQRLRPLVCTPVEARKMMASPFLTSPVMRCAFGSILPMAEPARTMVSGLTMLFKVGVSPPPQTAPARWQPSAQPSTSACIRGASENQPESPTAACIATEIGRAPQVMRSLTMVATVSIAISR